MNNNYTLATNKLMDYLSITLKIIIDKIKIKISINRKKKGIKYSASLFLTVYQSVLGQANKKYFFSYFMLIEFTRVHQSFLRDSRYTLILFCFSVKIK